MSLDRDRLLPAATPRAVTVRIFNDEGAQVRAEEFEERVIKVGKLSSSHLFLDHASVGRIHATIEVSPTGVDVVDLGATGGVAVNGQKVTKARLRSGDQVQFGDVAVIVEFGGGSVMDQVPLTERWACFALGRWQREMPTDPGDYPTCTKQGEPAQPITVYIDPRTGKAAAARPGWMGWWWSLPYPSLPELPERLRE